MGARLAASGLADLALAGGVAGAAERGIGLKIGADFLIGEGASGLAGGAARA